MARKVTAKMEPQTQNRAAGAPGSLTYIPGLPDWLPDPKNSPFTVEVFHEDGPVDPRVRLSVRTRVVGSDYYLDCRAIDSSVIDPKELVGHVVDEMTSVIKDSLIDSFGLQGHLDARIRRDHATDLHELLRLISSGNVRDVRDVRSWVIEKLND